MNSCKEPRGRSLSLVDGNESQFLNRSSDELKRSAGKEQICYYRKTASSHQPGIESATYSVQQWLMLALCNR